MTNDQKEGTLLRIYLNMCCYNRTYDDQSFDYTQWQRAYFDKMALGEFGKEAAAYARSHPYTGNAERL